MAPLSYGARLAAAVAAALIFLMYRVFGSAQPMMAEPLQPQHPHVDPGVANAPTDAHASVLIHMSPAVNQSELPARGVGARTQSVERDSAAVLPTGCCCGPLAVPGPKNGTVPLPVGGDPATDMLTPAVSWVPGSDNLPHTIWAQQQLYAAQNPTDCNSAHFHVVPLRTCGMGCVVHALSFALGRALDAGAVLLVHNPGSWHFMPTAPFFQPISSCPLPACMPPCRNRSRQYQFLPAYEVLHD